MAALMSLGQQLRATYTLILRPAKEERERDTGSGVGYLKLLLVTHFLQQGVPPNLTVPVPAD